MTDRLVYQFKTGDRLTEEHEFGDIPFRMPVGTYSDSIRNLFASDPLLLSIELKYGEPESSVFTRKTEA